MKNVVAGLLILLNTLAFGGTAENIQCRVSSNRASFDLGDTPDLRVEILNAGKEEVLLPGSLDGSEYRRRYPHVFFTVSGPDGQIEYQLPAGCGNTNEPRPQDFVTLGSMKVLDPYQRVDTGGFWSSSLLRTMTLDRPGDYVFTFHYSTAAPDMDAWRGGPVCPTCPLSGEVASLLEKVTRVSLSCSTRVSVGD